MVIAWICSKFIDPGEAARQRHALWLTAALRSGLSVPEIPVRPVREGGFAPTMASPEGRAWAERWWSDTLSLSDLDLPGV